VSDIEVKLVMQTIDLPVDGVETDQRATRSHLYPRKFMQATVGRARVRVAFETEHHVKSCDAQAR